MLPTLDVTVCDCARRDDGMVLLTVGRATRSVRANSEFEAVIAIDRQGRIAWHQQLPFGLMDCRRSLRDTLLVMGSDGRIVELTLSGRPLQQWYNPSRHPDGNVGLPVNTLKFHHSIAEIAPDRLLTLSCEQQPAQDADEDWTHDMADKVVLFDRAGKIHREISLFDLLDRQRQGHSHRIPYWRLLGYEKTTDWTHGNCAIIDPVDGNWMISLRHQDAVIKLTPDGEIVWILGDSSGWRAPWRDKLLRIEGGRPFNHQHDLSFTRNGDLMLFDNGTSGATPPAPAQPIEQRQSHAICYRIDPINRVATETWRYGGSKIGYSCYVSGVCETPNGNRFIAATGIVQSLDGGPCENPTQGVGQIELTEVTPDNEVVFRATIKAPGAGADNGWSGFRPEYLPPDQAAMLKLSNRPLATSADLAAVLTEAL